MKTLTNCVLVICATFLLNGCFSLGLRSSAGFYGPVPPSTELDGSYHQGKLSFIAQHDIEDVRIAVNKAAGFEGLFFDVQNEIMLSGVTHWFSPGSTVPCTPDQVYAVYLNNEGKRKTRVTVVVDHMSFCLSGVNTAHMLAQKLTANINSVLATYE